MPDIVLFLVEDPWSEAEGSRSWLLPQSGQETEEGLFDITIMTLSPVYPPFHCGHGPSTLSGTSPLGRAMF